MPPSLEEELIRSPRELKTTGDIANCLWTSDSINEKYNLITSNCQNFGKKLILEIYGRQIVEDLWNRYWYRMDIGDSHRGFSRDF